MDEGFPRGKEKLVGQQADEHDDEHDADDLAHVTEFAAEVQQMAEAFAAEDGPRPC